MKYLFEIEDYKVSAEFEHFNLGVRTVTTCILRSRDSFSRGPGVEAGRGVAICAPEDAARCSHKMGMRKALAKALENGGAVGPHFREVRERVWDQFNAARSVIAQSGFSERLLEERGYGAGV